jgi:hypothetical protein
VVHRQHQGLQVRGGGVSPRRDCPAARRSLPCMVTDPFQENRPEPDQEGSQTEPFVVRLEPPAGCSWPAFLPPRQALNDDGKARLYFERLHRWRSFLSQEEELDLTTLEGPLAGASAAVTSRGEKGAASEVRGSPGVFGPFPTKQRAPLLP